MSHTYTYDPLRICDGSSNQMRFELGDTAIEGGADTAALCDEEYIAIIHNSQKDGHGFRHAKLKCLEAIMMKCSFETDYSAGGMNLSLSQRYERFRELYLSLTRQFQKISTSRETMDGRHQFTIGMHDNPNL